MFIDAGEFPLPHEYRFFPLDGLVTSPPGRPRRADDRVPRLRQPRAQPGGGVPAGERDRITHPQHRPPPRQHPLRHGQPGRPGRLVHRRDRLGPDARARRHPQRDDRRGAVRRADHRHRAVHVREHRRAGTPDGGRADRGGRRRARDLPPRVRGRSVREAGAARPRPRERPAIRRGPAHRDRAQRRGLRSSPAPRRATPKA